MEIKKTPWLNKNVIIETIIQTLQNSKIWKSMIRKLFKRRFLEHSKAPGTSVKWSERASSWLYLMRLMRRKIFERHFKSKIGQPKIQILVRSSHTPILRVFFEFSNLSKTPQIIFFGQILTLVDVFQYREQF